MLANKYRPKKLADVIGQDVIVRILENSFKKGWHTSYVLSGIFGTGKTTIARIMAAMENCVNAPTKEPCGVCEQCVGIFDGTSMDIMELDSGSNRSIEDVRNIKKNASYAPVSSRIKYFILDEAHALTGYAADAALKLIEEPPPNTRFILCTTEIDALKDTILSRSLVLNFDRISWHELNGHVEKIAKAEGLEFEENALVAASKHAKGSARNALRNLQMIRDYAGGEKITTDISVAAIGVVKEELYFHLIQKILDVNCSDAVIIMNKLISSGAKAETLLSGILEYLRCLMLCHFFQGDMSVIGISKEEAARYGTQLSIGKPFIITEMEGLLMESRKALTLGMETQAVLESFIINSIIVVARFKAKSENNNA